ncbi:MAG: Calx-beta domain-containing protein [Leptolyngbyaceae cyanobacterium]
MGKNSSFQIGCGLTRWVASWVALAILCLGMLGVPAEAIAQETATVNFGQMPLTGVDVTRPTSIQFGPDSRLYVAEVNGGIKAFTLALQDGEYIATANETLVLPGGGGIVQSIRNHNDDGSLANNGGRLTTGLVVTGTPQNPVLYISSADPRRAKNKDFNLDTNSGIVTRATWTGTEWETVDIVRGLPRSEENHSLNGMVMSPDGTKLYLTVGGNTNNGAPSELFAYTAEYALSSTVVEIDLTDINTRPLLTDAEAGRMGPQLFARQYVYDLPTLDDPTVDNITDGVGEDAAGMDEAGPWGGKDGFNQTILPADAPLRIYLDGLRNNYDLALTESGRLYTVDNGSNSGGGGAPIFVNGEVTNEPNDVSPNNVPEPLFLLEEGGYYGHPVPVRANQDLAWTVYDDTGNPDASLTPSSTADVAARVPSSVNLQDGFVIDPSKFTDDPARLALSAVRIEPESPESSALVNLGSSSNGLAEYTADAFDGLLRGALMVTQFNGNVTLVNLSADGTAVEPLTTPGSDGILGTADDGMVDDDGVMPLVTGQSLPLDVTMGPDGTIWVAEFGGANTGRINVFAPSDIELPPNLDVDDDGILNAEDPFIRDASNGSAVALTPGQTLLWDFDEDLDGNLPGPGGYGGGLTGVMVDGVTDFEQFFQEPSTLSGQTIKLDNVKFITALGGGTTVVENVSNGDPLTTSNSGEYLFQTGLTVDPTVDDFTIKWAIFNPSSELSGPSQQIGGYIGTGDQSNYLKIVGVHHPDGEIQIVLENNDVDQVSTFMQADDLFTVPALQQIFFELTVDPEAATAVPTITYQTGGDNTKTVSGSAIDLSGTAVLDAILGNHTVQGQKTGLAVGLIASNVEQPAEDTFQAIFNDIEVTAPLNPTLTIADVTVNEADGTADFTVNLSAGATDQVSVDYATADGTATEGSDYTASSGTLTFDVATSAQTITVGILNDEEIEGDHDFQLNLSNAIAAKISDSVAIATIQDDDSNVLYRVDVGGTGIIAPDGDLTWSADTPANPSPHRVGTGGGRIYTSNNSVDLNSPTLPAGAQTQSIFQTVRYDPKAADNMEWAFEVEPGSEVEVRLYFSEWWTDNIGSRIFDVAVEGAVPTVFDDIDLVELAGGRRVGYGLSHALAVADGTLNLEFLHGDAGNPWLSGIEVIAAGNIPPALTIADVSVDEDANTATVIVDLSKASDEPITVDYATADGTATADSDYTATNGTLAFAAGETTQSFPVSILEDADFEGNETFSISLSNPTGGASLADAVAIATVDDNDLPDSGVLYRVNVGGAEIAAPDGDLAWSTDTAGSPSAHRVGAGGARLYASNNSVNLSSPTLPAGAQTQPIFQTVRYDPKANPNMQWAFEVEPGSEVEVRLYFSEWWTRNAGDRVFDVAVEGAVPTDFDDIDVVDLAGGKRVGLMRSHTVPVADGMLDLEFRHGETGNPWLSGIEIVAIGDSPSSPTLSIADVSVNEDAGTATFTAHLSAASDIPITVDYATADGTAAAGSDYTGTSGILNFAAGETTQAIAVDILDDTASEAAETFTVNLSNAVGTALTNSFATGTIADNEVATLPELSIDTVSVNEGAGTATFTVSLSPANNSPVTVDFATADGTAQDVVFGPDYGSVSGSLAFAAGETAQAIAVTIGEDIAIEADETFTVTLTNASGANIAAATGTATIFDNDGTQLPDPLLTYDFSGTDAQAPSFTITPEPGSGAISVVATASEAGVAKNITRTGNGLGVAGETDPADAFNVEIDGKGPGGDNSGTGGLEELTLTFDAPVKLETVSFNSANSDDDFAILVGGTPIVSGDASTSPKSIPLDVSPFNGVGTEFTFTVVSNTGSDDYILKSVQVSAA